MIRKKGFLQDAKRPGLTAVLKKQTEGDGRKSKKHHYVTTSYHEACRYAKDLQDAGTIKKGTKRFLQ